MYTVCLVLRRYREGHPSIEFYESRQALVEELVEQILYLEGEDAGKDESADADESEGADEGADADADEGADASADESADESEVADNAVQERRAELFATDHSRLPYYYEHLMDARGLYGEDYYDIEFFTSASPIRMSETYIESSVATEGQRLEFCKYAILRRDTDSSEHTMDHYDSIETMAEGIIGDIFDWCYPDDEGYEEIKSQLDADSSLESAIATYNTYNKIYVFEDPIIVLSSESQIESVYGWPCGTCGGVRLNYGDPPCRCMQGSPPPEL